MTRASTSHDGCASAGESDSIAPQGPFKTAEEDKYGQNLLNRESHESDSADTEDER